MTRTTQPPRSANGGGPRTPRSRRWRLPALAGLVLVAVTLGACTKSADVATSPGSTAAPATTKSAGGADADRTTAGSTPGTAPGTTSTTRRTTSTPLTTEVAPTTVTTKGPVTTKPPVTGPVTTVPNTPADAAFCAKGKTMEDVLGDPTDTAGFLAKIKTVFAELTAAAPPEIKADMESINTVVQSATSMESLDELDPATEKRLDEASGRVDAWAVAHCGSDFNS